MPLRDYQEPVCDNTVELLKQYHIAYIAGEMRTGKTLTALTAANRYGATKVLFLTKKKAIPDVKKNYALEKFNFEICILNYERLTAYQEYDAAGKPIGFRFADFANDYLLPDLVICDEAHGLGQFPVPANKVKQVQIIALGLPIIFLSGTPSPESYSQLYHQFKVSTFSPFLAWKTFYLWAKGCKAPTDTKGEYVDLPGFVDIRQKKIYGRLINDYSRANKELIDHFTKHLFITMTQHEAGFEQVVEDIILPVKMKDTTLYLAKKLLKDRVITSNDGSVILGDSMGKLQQKIHQIMSGSVRSERYHYDQLDKEGNPIVSMEPKTFDDTKAKFIKSHFEGQKIAILYLYKMEYAAILMNYGADRLTEDPEEFRNTDKTFVGQIRSVREGVDLSCADALVMYNIEFSSLSYQQGRQRLQAQKRDKPALCYWIFSDQGIEHKIYERVINKLDYTVQYFKKDYL